MADAQPSDMPAPDWASDQDSHAEGPGCQARATMAPYYWQDSLYLWQGRWGSRCRRRAQSASAVENAVGVSATRPGRGKEEAQETMMESADAEGTGVDDRRGARHAYHAERPRAGDRLHPHPYDHIHATPRHRTPL